MAQEVVFTSIPLDHLQKIIASEVRDAVACAIAQLPQPSAHTVEEFLTRKETAAALRVSLVTLRDWEKRGILLGERRGRRVLYRRSAVEAPSRRRRSEWGADEYANYKGSACIVFLSQVITVYDAVSFDHKGIGMQQLVRVLGADSVHHNPKTGASYCKGRARNLDVYATNGFATVKGSLPKFLFGENLSMLTWASTRHVLEELSDLFGVSMFDARVYQLEFGANIPLASTVASYFPLLGQASRYVKTENHRHGGCGIYYSQLQRELALYDKILEMVRKHVGIPPDARLLNVLRYEIRYLKHHGFDPDEV